MLFTITLIIPLINKNKEKNEFQIFTLPKNEEYFHQKEKLIEINVLNNEGIEV